jgi:hypothetical protein
MRKIVVSAMVGASLLGTFGGAASAGTTTTSFTLNGNAAGLSISVPGTASGIATGSTGATSLSGTLGSVTVTDPRGLLVATWTATVSATSFTTGGASSNETVAKSAITYSSGAGSAALGQVGAMVPSVNSALGNSAIAASWSGVGNSTVTWTPTLTFALLASQVAGTYTGTITHSVA